MGLKESGLRGSLRNVSVGISAIPDSAIAQFDPRSESVGTPETLTDSSGNNNDATNNGIEVVSDGINGNQSFYLDGESDYANLPDMFTGLSAAEAMVVLERDGLPTDNTEDGLWNITSTNDTLYPWVNDTGTIFDDFGRSVRNNGSAQVTLTDGHIYNIRSGTNHTAEQNEMTIFDTTDGSVTFSSSPELGRTNSENIRYFAGWFGIVVFYNQVLDSDTRSKEYQRLAEAYGITL